VITVVHLYPRELGINGDVGNVMAVAKRAEWRGMPLTVVNHEVGAELPSAAHLVHIGSGPVSGQELVLDDLARIAPTLRGWAASGVPFLAIAGGWHLLGRTITAVDGASREGVGIFPCSTVQTNERTVREVFARGGGSEVAGFENFGAATTFTEGESLLGHGIVWGASVGTNLHGPFLPMNPRWADRMLASAAALAGVPMGDGDERVAEVDGYAAKSRAAIRQRVGTESR